MSPTGTGRISRGGEKNKKKKKEKEKRHAHFACWKYHSPIFLDAPRIRRMIRFSLSRFEFRSLPYGSPGMRCVKPMLILPVRKNAFVVRWILIFLFLSLFVFINFHAAKRNLQFTVRIATLVSLLELC